MISALAILEVARYHLFMSSGYLISWLVSSHARARLEDRCPLRIPEQGKLDTG
jgi:hypothetical protein